MITTPMPARYLVEAPRYRMTRVNCRWRKLGPRKSPPAAQNIATLVFETFSSTNKFVSIDRLYPSISKCSAYGTSPAARRGPPHASPPKPSARNRQYFARPPPSSQHGKLLYPDSQPRSTCRQGDRRAGPVSQTVMASGIGLTAWQ